MKTKLKRLLKNIVLPLSQRQTPAGELVTTPAAETAAVRWKSLLTVALCAVGLAAFAAEPEAVQLWENGPYFATCNVGANEPQEPGYYFWWGDTVGYTNSGSAWLSVKDGTTSIKFSSSDATAGQTYNHDNTWLTDNKWIDGSGNLVVSDDAATNRDAARAHLGAPWRMMTKEELDALVANCTNEWTTLNGVYGRKVTGKGAYASNSIFFPANGYGKDSGLDNAGTEGNYWSSTPDQSTICNAWYFVFTPSQVVRGCYDGRFIGHAVRPVRDAQ